ncbi:MAG: Ig-like domain-containing protein, partial [Verrucomicrobiales bacterium]
MESVPPWAVWGDSNGVFTGQTLQLGSHTLSATPFSGNSAAGTAGALATVSFTVVSGSTPPPSGNPVVSITAPANGATQAAPASFTIQANASDAGGSIVQVEFFVGATSLGTDPASPYSAVFQSASTGTFSLTAIATDNSGNKTTSGAVVVTIGSTPPPSGLAVIGFNLINSTSDQPVPGFAPIPNGGTIYLGDLPSPNINIQIVTNDNSDFGSVKFQLTGPTALSPNPKTESVPPWSLWGDSSGNYGNATLTAGSHTLTATPYSNSNVAGQPLTIQFTVAPGSSGGGTPGGNPVVSLTSPANGATQVQPATFTLTATASDSGGSIAQVEFFSNGTSLGIDLSAPYSVPFSGVTQGSYSLTAVAKDNAANTTTSTPVTVQVTALPTGGNPVVSLTSPANGATQVQPASFTVTATASDSGGSIAQVEFFSNGTSLGVDLSTPYSVPFTGVTQGSYTLTAVAKDNAANTTTSTPVTVQVTAAGSGGTVSGELKQWHRLTFTFNGPDTSETATPNPFLDYRLDVTFTGPSGQRFVVPGFYAADGNAANTSSGSGNKWRAHFAPDAVGGWSYVAAFRTGSSVAVDDTVSGTATSFNGASGAFNVAASDKTGRDFRGKGMLQYVGGSYLRFAGSGEYFLKEGADSPENLLSYADFDGPFKTDGFRDDLIKTWTPHV